MWYVFIAIEIIMCLFLASYGADTMKNKESWDVKELKKRNTKLIVMSAILLIIALVPILYYEHLNNLPKDNHWYLVVYRDMEKVKIVWHYTAATMSIGFLFFAIERRIRGAHEKEYKEVEKKLSAEQARHKAELALQAQRKKKYNDFLVTMQSPAKIIKFAEEYVMVNEEKKLILLNEHVYNFKDIINYNLTDSPTVIQHHDKGTATTKTSTKSMVGRAVVGDVLLGGAGAMAGALTAKKNTEINLGDTTSTTKHDYTIVVNVNSISNPVERLHLGEDGETANDILGVLSVIMIRNK